MKSCFMALCAVAGLAFIPVEVSATTAVGEQPVATTPDGGSYWGPLVGGLRQGSGRVEWRNGARYEGGFKDGLYSGKGLLYFGNGDVYEGDFVQGLPAGTGTLKSVSGLHYRGTFSNGFAEGRGKMVLEDGTVYEGDIRLGRPDGIGKWVGETAEYEGEFRHGQIWGRGELRYKSGRVYKGEFVRASFEGKGRMQETNGTVYEGDFKGGEFTGNGVIIYANGARQEGRFLDWQLDGPGKYSDGRGTTYESVFKAGIPVGKMSIKNQDGSWYVGDVKDWSPNGQGELHLANGDVYKGAFEYGLYQGEGTLSYAKPKEDGRTEDSGIWQYGQLKKKEEERERLARASAEEALYTQSGRLEQALHTLKGHDPEAINLYLLVVGGDGSQKVFRREAEFVRTEFDTQFGTRGRSIALINGPAKGETEPLATVTSVRRTIDAIAGAMDKGRDILFIYVTSHGSKEDGISLNPLGMKLPALSGSVLGSMLKEAGIRWKVVVISACHAGAMFDGLRDPGTLMIAAARADRQSFGCADENDFTYFGRAYFKEALPKATSFEDAFSTATALITQWEDRDTSKQSAIAGGRKRRPRTRIRCRRWKHPSRFSDNSAAGARSINSLPKINGAF